VIGVIYVFANTLAIGLISFSGMEAYHFQEMLAGHLLFIDASQLVFTYLSYILIGLIVVWLHKKFLSNQSLIWDFVFYLLFGWVVTSSVKLVGVLLVFSYLLLPLLTIYLIKPHLKGQLIYGWLIGVIVSLLGLLLSLYVDLPPSIVIIGLLIMTWAVITTGHQLLKSNQKF
jgi:zinc/manganese transport system permease protein